MQAAVFSETLPRSTLSAAPETYAGESDTCGDGAREEKNAPGRRASKNAPLPAPHRSSTPAAATPRTERRLDLKPLPRRLEARADRDAAVDGERVARDVARRLVERQVPHEARDLLGGAQPTERDGALHLLEHVLS